MTYVYMNPGDKRDTPTPLQQDDSQGHDSERDALATEVAALRARVVAMETAIEMADMLVRSQGVLECCPSVASGLSCSCGTGLLIDAYLDAREACL